MQESRPLNKSRNSRTSRITTSYMQLLVNFIGGQGEPKRHGGAFVEPWNALFLCLKNVYFSANWRTATRSPELRKENDHANHRFDTYGTRPGGYKNEKSIGAGARGISRLETPRKVHVPWPAGAARCFGTWSAGGNRER